MFRSHCWRPQIQAVPHAAATPYTMCTAPFEKRGWQKCTARPPYNRLGPKGSPTPVPGPSHGGLDSLHLAPSVDSFCTTYHIQIIFMRNRSTTGSSTQFNQGFAPHDELKNAKRMRRAKNFSSASCLLICQYRTVQWSLILHTIIVVLYYSTMTLIRVHIISLRLSSTYQLESIKSHWYQCIVNVDL